jgi:hypothetical protein
VVSFMRGRAGRAGLRPSISKADMCTMRTPCSNAGRYPARLAHCRGRRSVGRRRSFLQQ